LGEDLSLPVLYTGNIYRAIAHKILRDGQDPYNKNNAIAMAKKLKLTDLDNPELTLEKVGEYASIIGVYKELRDVTYKFQRQFIEDSSGAVIEGRDIGTVICPEADFKFYITADVEVRAKRRFAQQCPSSSLTQAPKALKIEDLVNIPEIPGQASLARDDAVNIQKNMQDDVNSDYETILADLKMRDERDQNRIVAPLKPAEDAIIIDSSKLNAQETLDKILSLID
jgi:cytidylate kinase